MMMLLSWERVGEICTYGVFMLWSDVVPSELAFLQMEPNQQLSTSRSIEINGRDVEWADDEDVTRSRFFGNAERGPPWAN